MTQELVEFVLRQTGRPLDRWAVAATLESGGVRDVDAREKYGRRDVFDLADDVYERCLDAATEPAPADAPQRRDFAASAQRFLQGGFFFVPLSLQFGCLLLLGYGQWASLDFTRGQASVVAVALLASFGLTGAFAQALGYLGPYFATPGRHRLVVRVVVGVVGLGLATLLAGAAVAWLVNAAFGAYDRKLFGAGLVYYGLAGFVSLLSAVLYMLKHYPAMLVATVSGLVVVGIVRHTGLGIYGAHWLGLGTTIAIEAGWAAVVLARRALRMAPELTGARLPPVPVLAALVLPYAVYGAAYYALLFVDRLAAWSAGSRGMPFTFRASYEIALDWALICVVPAVAMLEVTVYAFSERLSAAGRKYRASASQEHNLDARRFYFRQLAVVALLLVAGSVLVFSLGRLATDLELTKFHGLFGSTTTREVFPLALAGYWLLVVSLFNSLFLLTLGRPALVLRAILPGVAVDVAVAIILSRTLPYWTAVGGLAAGAFVFAVLSTRTTLRVLGAVDYHYFAAY